MDSEAQRCTGDYQGSGRATNQMGWQKERLEFYDKATKFFHCVRVEEHGEMHPRLDQVKSEARDWFYIQVLSWRNKETQSRSSTKKRAVRREAPDFWH